MPFFGGGQGDYFIVGTNIKGGTDAAPAVVGDNNMALGLDALQALQNGDANIAIGTEAGMLLTDFSGNVVIGHNALNASDGVEYSVVIGHGAQVDPNFTQNVIIGAGANGLGEGAVAIGESCGAGEFSVALGWECNTGSNSIAIGRDLVVADDAIVIGDASQTSIEIGGIDFSGIASYAIVTPPETDYSVTTGDGTTGANGSFLVQLGNPAVNVDGANLSLWGGYSSGTGKGSNVKAEAGYSENGEAGYFSGQGGEASGTAKGGDAILSAGNANTGNGGTVFIYGGESTGGGNGGDIYLEAGVGAVNGSVSYRVATVTKFSVDPNGNGTFLGEVFSDSLKNLTPGTALTVRGNSGTGVDDGAWCNVGGGNSVNGNAGYAQIFGGNATGSGYGGDLYASGGNGATQNAGSAWVFGGYSASALGGNVYLYPGAGGAGNGSIQLLRSDYTTKNLESDDTGLGFFGTAPIAKPTVTGNRGGNAALQSLIAQLAALGIITDGTT